MYHRPLPGPPAVFHPSNSPSRQLIPDRKVHMERRRSTRPRRRHRQHRSRPPANASRSTPHPSETSTSPKRTLTPTHASRSLPTPRARLVCALNPLGPSFPCCVVGLRVECGRTGQDGDFTEHTTHDRPRHDFGADAIDYRMFLDHNIFSFAPLVARLDAANVHTRCPCHSKRYHVRIHQSII